MEMQAFHRIVLWANWLVALAWLLRVLSWRRLIRRVPHLTERGRQAGSPVLPQLTVVVPARNEAAGIAATLDSLLHAEGVSLQIIAVDDRSQDETGAIMDRIAARAGAEGRSLSVLHITELPAGWLGKTHAMAVGSRHAHSEWLLFTDGDVLFRRDALCLALEFAVSSGADHFVLMPTVTLKTRGERMMLAFIHVMVIWALRLWRVPDAQARQDTIGLGAFNLIRREVYDDLGGWESLRMEVVEDLALGRLVKRRGFAQRVAFGPGLISVRWAQGALGVVENLSKNLFAIFRFRTALLLGFVPVFIMFTLFPLIAWLAGAASCAATCITLTALWLAYRSQARYQPFHAREMILFPVASALMLYALLRSMLLALWRGGVSWRGTFYSLSELRRQRRS